MREYFHTSIEYGGIKLNKIEQQALVAECRASGMTAKAWCETNGIAYSRYLSWATNVNKESQHIPQQWVSVTRVKEADATSSEVRLTCGKWTICVTIGFSPTLLADVIKVVDDAC